MMGNAWSEGHKVGGSGKGNEVMDCRVHSLLVVRRGIGGQRVTE